MKKISASDAVFLDMETPSGPMIIGGLFILDPSTAPGSFVRHRDILNYAETRLHLAPNLRRKLVFHPLGLDEPRLIDDPAFDLEFHVRHIALPKPRDWRQLKIMMSRLISRPMDMHRPLWEMYIIEGLENLEGIPEDAFAMLFKMHHATFDGKAGGAALWAFMQDTPEYEPLPPEKRWVPERHPDFLGWTVSSVQEGMQQWMSSLKALPRLGKSMASSIQGTARTVTDKSKKLLAPKTRFQQRITTHRVWDFVRFDMADVQTLRTLLGKPKMNDLMLAIIGGALRRYLDHHGELPQDASLIGACPINVRTGDPKEGGNFVSGMRVTLGTDIADPVERLRVIAASTRSEKAQAEALGANFIDDFLKLTIYPFRARMMRYMMRAPERFNFDAPTAVNTIITNAPNPPGGHYFTGAKVLSYAGFGPINDYLGLFHTVTGMDFEVTISATSCRETLGDIAFYMQCLRDSFADLQEAARRAANDAAADAATDAVANRAAARAAPKARRRVAKRS
ncbi:MAG: wax ester/triacylglycerol synthase family O-acyltransferase [Novosphingobium sp.]|nr:wax ester/triacylglycerol synthase family O-acyltransferase [Novosphingobium sp.]